MQSAIDAEGLFSHSAAHFGGTSFWVSGPDWLDSRILAKRAMKDGVLIEAGDAFFDDKTPLLNYFRLAYSAISSERIPEGVARLAAGVRTLKP